MGVDMNVQNKTDLTGRLGFAIEGGNPRTENGRGLSGYLLTNIVHDFSDTSGFTANGTQVNSDISRTQLEVRLGVEFSADDEDHLTFFAEGGLSQAIDSREYSNVKGLAGLTWQF